MKKFKIGDVVFVSNKRFDRDYDSYLVKTGDILTVNDNDHYYGYQFTFYNRGMGEVKHDMGWGYDHAKLDLTLYNKKNWCRVFLEFMEMQNV